VWVGVGVGVGELREARRVGVGWGRW
jgi:hypothetical protein